MSIDPSDDHLARLPSCLLASDVRMFRAPSGRFHATHPAGCYEQWEPYTEIFEHVQIAARITVTPGPDFGPADGPGVSIHALPNYSGPGQLVRALPALLRGMASIPLQGVVPVLRCPEPLAVLIALRAVFIRAQYVALVVADVESCWVAAVSRSRLGRWSGRFLRCLVGWLVRRAVGVIYVTERSLQQRYPPGPGTPTMIRSNARLNPLSFSSRDNKRGIGRRLIVVGSQQSTAKGHDVAIRALPYLASRDPRFELVLVGDGAQQAQLRRLAAVLGVSDRVIFRGRLSSDAVLEELSRADLFLMPSRSEGLPRALIEAMAAGLPAAGSDVGGIPELLEPSCLVPPDDPEALARLILDLVVPDRWLAESRRNRDLARDIAEGARADHLRDFLGRFVPEVVGT